MFVVTRKVRQSIAIGPDITVTIVRIQGREVRIGINAPGLHVSRIDEELED